MMGRSFEDNAAKLERAFDEYIGLTFLVIICLFYCIFTPSPYWLPPIIMAKIGCKAMWTTAKSLIITRMLQSICNKHLAKGTNRKPFFRNSICQALEGTRFDKNHFGIFPNAREIIFILMKLKEYALALSLIKELQLSGQEYDQTLALIKQFAINCSQIQDQKRIGKDALLARDNMEKFITDISHHKLTSSDADAKHKKIPKQWIRDMTKFAVSGKAENQLHQTSKRIRKVSQNDDCISKTEPTYLIPENSLHLFYNLFVNTKTSESTRGLGNLGNTCYMNSALQCLHKAFELTKAIQQTQSPSSCFVRAYLQLMEELSRTTESPYRPSEIKAMIGKYNPIFDDNGQHDAGELLSTVLSHLNEDLNTVSNKRTYKIDTSVPRTDDELLQEYIKKDSLRSHSVIEQLFFGRFLTIYQCRKCGGELKLFEKFNVLFLPVPNRRQLDLNACMKEFTLADRMEGANAWWCSACEADTDTDKFMSVYQHSPILIICLKRFTNSKKITSFINFEREITLQHISSKPATQGTTYDLFGVINHVGSSMHYGHYYSYCLDGPTWRKYDDENVSEISQRQLVTSNAFVLLYRVRR